MAHRRERGRARSRRPAGSGRCEWIGGRITAPFYVEDDVEGRMIFTEGRVHADGVVTAEAQGIFIPVDPARMLELLAKRDAWESAQGASEGT